MPSSICAICSQLKPVEKSFSKYAAPEQDHPLPAAAAQLVIIKDLSGRENEERHHVRLCPACGALYSYDFSYEYLVNGSEDEEVLSRLTADEAAVYCRSRVRYLEALRQDIDRLESAAGALGDYLDRGRPIPAEAEADYNQMQAYIQSASHQRLKLQQQVEAFRLTYPEALTSWAGAHIRVCQGYLAAADVPTPDGQTRRYLAQSTLDAWQGLTGSGETFISINSAFLGDYLIRLQV